MNNAGLQNLNTSDDAVKQFAGEFAQQAPVYNALNNAGLQNLNTSDDALKQF